MCYLQHSLLSSSSEGESRLMGRKGIAKWWGGGGGGSERERGEGGKRGGERGEGEM